MSVIVVSVFFFFVLSPSACCDWLHQRYRKLNLAHYSWLSKFGGCVCVGGSVGWPEWHIQVF